MQDQMVSLVESDSARDEGPLEGSMAKGRQVENSRTENVWNIGPKGRKFSLMESDSDRDNAKPSVPRRMTKKDQNKVNGKKTKFEEYLEMEMKLGPSMEEDMEMERRLAKKLKVKKGKLDDGGDGLNLLFEGVPSFHDSSGEEYSGRFENETGTFLHIDDKKSKKNTKKTKKAEQEFGLEKDDSHDVQTGESLSFESDEGDEEYTTLDSETESIQSTEKKESKRRKKKKRKSEQEHGFDDDASDMKLIKNMPSESDEEGEAITELETDTALGNRLQSMGKYIPPHLRFRSGDDSLEQLQNRRRIRGISFLISLTFLFFFHSIEC